MKNTVSLVFALALCGGAANAQSKAKLQGAWRVAEVKSTGPNARTNSNPQPGLVLFTGKYYSIMTVNSEQPRPDTPADAAKATGQQLAAVWGPFTANSGAYEISGDTIVVHPQVAKNPQVMRAGSSTTYSFKLDGKTLTVTMIKDVGGAAVANPTTIKLTRVE